MKDLKHLYEFEKLLESANNALVQQACAEGKHALAYTCYHMPEVLLNTGNCFSVRLRAPLTGSLDISSYYMSNFICDYCKSLLERGIEGGYNFLSGLMGTETCSEMNRALEHFELLRLVDNEQFFVTFLDMPFKVTENTVRHYVDQLRRKVLTPLLLLGLTAIIVKGIISLLIQVLDNQTPDDILKSDLHFIDDIGLSEHLSPTRSNGLLAMVKQMRLYALAFQAKQKMQ